MGMEQHANLRQLFQATAEVMRAELRGKAAQVPHSGERGEHGERALRDFLRNHLPKKYGVDKGFVISEDGSTSHAADLVIYDATGAPRIPTDGERYLFPMESALAVIEVTLTLDSRKLKDDAAKIAGVKRLPRQPPVVRTYPGLMSTTQTPIPLGCIFGFEAGVSANTLTGTYCELAYPPDLTVDLVCALDRCLLAHLYPQPDRSHKIGRADMGSDSIGIVASADDALFVFFAVLLGFLDAITPEPPDLFAYLQRAGYPQRQ